MERKRMLNAFKEARAAGPYDEWAVLPASVDTQVHLSRNDRPQPFYLICDHDTVLAQLSGEALVEFREASVLAHRLEPGDHVYVPAGTPHRITPRTESVQLRYKGRTPILEGVAWYCERCGAEVWREEWELGEEAPREGYRRACTAFNANPERRVCPTCGAAHRPVDLTGLPWAETTTPRAD
jgi:3-hydroxyanthranilate 3,4-dioxygenase